MRIGVASEMAQMMKLYCSLLTRPTAIGAKARAYLALSNQGSLSKTIEAV
jgi:hypothetical protein